MNFSADFDKKLVNKLEIHRRTFYTWRRKMLVGPGPLRQAGLNKMCKHITSWERVSIIKEVRKFMHRITIQVHLVCYSLYILIHECSFVSSTSSCGRLFVCLFVLSEHNLKLLWMASVTSKFSGANDLCVGRVSGAHLAEDSHAISRSLQQIFNQNWNVPTNFSKTLQYQV
jgi:hypothetical protein